jgi:hypothetical protein
MDELVLEESGSPIGVAIGSTDTAFWQVARSEEAAPYFKNSLIQKIGWTVRTTVRS